MSAHGTDLLEKGWLVLRVRDFPLSQVEIDSLTTWEKVVSAAFDTTSERKVNSGEYRVEHGVSVGYRHDDEREFLETRLTSEGKCEPDFSDTIDRYSDTIVAMYSGLNRIASSVLNDVSDILGWDRNLLLDLTDIGANGILPKVPVSKKKGPSEESVPYPDTAPEMRIQYSSSLLRICKYAHDITGNGSQSKSVSFGAHTDSSFITIAPVSSTPGLEVVDQQRNVWICPELNNGDEACDGYDVRVLVFVGEFLQVLTKNRFKATVHRVVEFPFSFGGNTNSSSESSISTRYRLSCPYLIRGLNDAVINMHDIKYIHQQDALTPDKVPDLDGTTMKLLHKLLDLKRQKCFRDNDSKPGNWVLSAYPIERMPADDDVAVKTDNTVTIADGRSV